ncbi:sensor histidine kinase [Rhodococcus chondri]|uniref:histidine kinase n=1 Tax=Rhodococcus chondri TaxID=3065941 RepID=A0ABU7JYA1_9NOCA|nr:ATP-binding protein [Rhodococcus sp. CC-R104]MEE2034514.1 ATP-binding protein [Rhodococcus sp. CC-R104]
MGVLVVVGTVVGSHFLTRTTEVSNYVRDRIQPARVEAYRLQSALVSQETGARGYILAADPEFLEPYTSGAQEEQDAAVEIRRFLEGEEKLLADVEAIERGADEWRRVYAVPLVENVVPGQPAPVDPAAVEAGRIAFDQLRSRFEVLNSDLADARLDGVAQLEDIRSMRDRVLAAMIAIFLLSGVCLTVLVQIIVVRPLSRLGSETRRVAAGDFEKPIRTRGPADIRGLAADVESMREHIVDELQISRERHAQLESQAVDLRRSNAELEQFAYVASHDLQEPLRKVASFCQLLEKRYGDKLDERGTQYIAFAVDGAKRMQILINDLLTFSRVGRVSDAHVRIELDRTLDAALTNLSEAVDESEVRIERPDTLPEVVGDPTLLIMLWQNLVGNAIKFRHPDRPVVISIECEQADGDDETDAVWQFSVTDNGIGIGEEFAEKVFVIFQRLHGRDIYSGTGIGLAVCRKIVEYHGGEIWIDQAHRDGTRFCFTIPVVAEEETTSDAALEGAST